MTYRNYIPKSALKVTDKATGSEAYLYTQIGVFLAVCYIGNAKKPTWHFRFRSEAERAKRVEASFAGARQHKARVTEGRAKRKAWVPTYKIGDVFRTCWGYDQTNVEFFEITEVKGKYAILRELTQDRVETGFMQGKCVPLPGAFAEARYKGDDRGEPIRRLMQDGRIKIDECRTAWPVSKTKIGGVDVIEVSNWTAYA